MVRKTLITVGLVLLALAASVAITVFLVLPQPGASGPGTSQVRVYDTPSVTATAHSAANPLRIQTSVAVWANIAQAIGGRYVQAAATIHLPGQDPHSYEATVRDQLAVNRADLTITNGGGYDTFFQRLVAAKPTSRGAMRLTLSSHISQPGGSYNPHLWYDLGYVRALAGVIGRAEAAGFTDPAIRAEIARRIGAYQARLDLLIASQTRASTQTAGKTVILTEGFAARLVRNLKMTDATPQAFRNSVEQEQDASPKVMRQLQLLLTRHKVNALVLNVQTSGAQTNQLAAWATAAGVPVLRLGEVLPQHQTYLTWFSSNLNRIEAAIR